MPVAVTTIVVFAVVATTISLFIYLPAVAIVETISPRRASARAAIWLSALVLPVLGGIVGSAIGVYSSIYDTYGSPHLTGDRPHLCSRWMLNAPDARGYVWVFGLICAALIAGGILRAVFSTARSWLLVRRFRDAAPSPEGVAVIDSDTPFLATLGAIGPLVVTTTGTEALLDPDELRAALSHEAAHARRHDNLRELLASACVAFLIFVPTTRLFRRYWREEVERACDQEAARHTTPEAVASALVELARVAHKRSEASRQPLEGAGDARWHHSIADVERRASRLLEAQSSEALMGGPGSRLPAILVALAAALAIALTIAATARQLDDTLHCLAETLMQLPRVS